MNTLVFDKNTVEFVAVAAEYCNFIEQQPERFVTTATRLLPLLYLKATLLPEGETLGVMMPAPEVTESGYEQLRASLADLLGEDDEYLEVFTQDMAYSEAAITKNISEDLCDIYQAVKDFIAAFQTADNDTMHEAVVEVREKFVEYWGQTLVNSLRALHNIKYNGDKE